MRTAVVALSLLAVAEAFAPAPAMGSLKVISRDAVCARETLFIYAEMLPALDAPFSVIQKRRKQCVKRHEARGFS